MKCMFDDALQLYDSQGHRKYLTHEELEAFLLSIENARPRMRTICLVMAHTGCHVSEALKVTANEIDIFGECITFKNRNKRRPTILRAVPVKKPLLDILDEVHGITEAQRSEGRSEQEKLWSYSREHVWRGVNRYMQEAGIEGPQATPRGLRHAFGVRMISLGIQRETLSQWLGHGSSRLVERYVTMVDEYRPPSDTSVWL